jgi:hypothetical protein
MQQDLEAQAVGEELDSLPAGLDIVAGQEVGLTGGDVAVEVEVQEVFLSYLVVQVSPCSLLSEWSWKMESVACCCRCSPCASFSSCSHSCTSGQSIFASKVNLCPNQNLHAAEPVTEPASGGVS